MFIHCPVDLLRARMELLGQLAGAFLGTDIAPQIQRIGGGQREPAGHTFALPPDHVHWVAPVAQPDITEATLISGVEQPTHRGRYSLKNSEAMALAINHRL